jgi:hypothetical protein
LFSSFHSPQTMFFDTPAYLYARASSAPDCIHQNFFWLRLRES